MDNNKKIKNGRFKKIMENQHDKKINLSNKDIKLHFCILEVSFKSTLFVNDTPLNIKTRKN